MEGTNEENSKIKIKIKEKTAGATASVGDKKASNTAQPNTCIILHIRY
jgi:hypothetical protein